MWMDFMRIVWDTKFMGIFIQFCGLFYGENHMKKQWDLGGTI